MNCVCQAQNQTNCFEVHFVSVLLTEGYGFDKDNWDKLGITKKVCELSGHVLIIINYYRATACNAMHDISVAILSIRLSDVCIVTQLNDALQIF